MMVQKLNMFKPLKPIIMSKSKPQQRRSAVSINEKYHRKIDLSKGRILSNNMPTLPLFKIKDTYIPC